MRGAEEKLAHLVFFWLPARAASALQLTQCKTASWLLDEKNSNNFCHMEEEGAVTHPDGLSELKTDAHVHQLLCKRHQGMEFFIIIILEKCFLKLL